MYYLDLHCSTAVRICCDEMNITYLIVLYIQFIDHFTVRPLLTNTIAMLLFPLQAGIHGTLSRMCRVRKRYLENSDESTPLSEDVQEM